MPNGHGRESDGCVELGFSEGNCLVQLSGKQSSRCLAGGDCLGFP